MDQMQITLCHICREQIKDSDDEALELSIGVKVHSHCYNRYNNREIGEGLQLQEVVTTGRR